MNADALRTLTGWVPWLGIAGMVIAVITYFDIMRKPAGNELMRKLCDKIHHGAFVFIRREYQIIAVFIVVVFAVLSFTLSVWTAVAFLVGSALLDDGGASRDAGVDAEQRADDAGGDGRRDVEARSRSRSGAGRSWESASRRSGSSGSASSTCSRRIRSSSTDSRWGRARSRSSPASAGASTRRAPTSDADLVGQGRGGNSRGRSAESRRHRRQRGR